MPKKAQKPVKTPQFFKIVPSAVFGLAGLFYLLSPYDLIVETGLAFRAQEGDQITFGIVFLVMAGIFWLVSNKALK